VNKTIKRDGQEFHAVLSDDHSDIEISQGSCSAVIGCDSDGHFVVHGVRRVETIEEAVKIAIQVVLECRAEERNVRRARARLARAFADL